MQRLARIGYIALLVAILVPGCQWLGGERGSGTAKTEQRQVAAFHKIELGGAMRAEITAGGAQVVEISGDDNIVPLLTTEVRDGRIRIEPSKSISPKLPLVVKITASQLTALSTSGSTKVQVQGVSGDSFAIDVSGSAEITAKGQARALDVQVSGSASIDTKDLKAQRVKIALSGSGDLDVYASEQLDTSISGSGTVRYYGNPPEVRKSISGSGKLEPR